MAHIVVKKVKLFMIHATANILKLKIGLTFQLFTSVSKGSGGNRLEIIFVMEEPTYLPSLLTVEEKAVKAKLLPRVKQD